MISSTESTIQDRAGTPEEAQLLSLGDGKQEVESSNRPETVKDDGPVKGVDDKTAEDPAVAAKASEAETWAFAYTQLARQIEYYFSKKNLTKDTYLQTLKHLNDGCVPLSILANFVMVKRLVASLTALHTEEARQEAVEEAVQNYSDRLVIRLVDTKTGLRVDPDSEDAVKSSHCILAVGTVDDKPLDLDTSIPPPSPIVKTIVLRDVVSGVTSAEIHELFSCDGFPPVTSIQPDVANCWFVSLDTDDRDVVLDVLLSLRSMSLRDHPVHARLKSTVVSTAVDAAPVMPWFPPVPEPTKRKKKKTRGKKKRGPTLLSRGGDKADSTTKVLPPTLGEDNFPTLQDKRVEWETPCVVESECQERHGSSSSEGEEFEDRIEKEDEPRSLKAMSDGASTATTTSSSLESVPKKTVPSVGYAAVLMGKTKESDS